MASHSFGEASTTNALKQSKQSPARSSRFGPSTEKTQSQFGSCATPVHQDAARTSVKVTMGKPCAQQGLCPRNSPTCSAHTTHMSMKCWASLRHSKSGMTSCLHRIGNRILLQYSTSRYCKNSLNSLTMSLAQNTFLDIQNILCSRSLHLYGEEHSEYYYDDLTVFWEINLFQHQSIQNTMKVSSYENTENNTLNIQHSILALDMLRIFRLFLQYPFSIFWQNILSPIL